jgi:molecular chaperone HscA
MPAGMPRVQVQFQIDANGILSVTAAELRTSIEQTIEVKPSYGLTDEEVERMLLDSYEHAEEDLKNRQLLSERIEAQRILAATRSAMEGDPELLTDEVRAAIDEAMAALESAAAGDDHRAIHRAVEALDQASHPFAEARMNRAVRAAVRGRGVDEVAAELGEDG